MTPLEHAETFALRFRGTANDYALGYGGPVYLVGSMLTSPSPGDIDIRVQISREDAVAMFGEHLEATALDWSPGKLRMHREQLKQSRRLTRRWRLEQRFDFQFQIALFSDTTGEPIQDDRPRLRLDRVPNDFFNAGRGDP